jgi:sterol desaturase/sphingolipid hydroxylase (fatty acid hydroxylase superfamily)
MSTIVYIAVPAFLLLMAAEAWRSGGLGNRIRGYEWRDTLASLSMGVGNVVVSTGTLVLTLAAYTALHEFALFDIGFAWWAWPLALLGDDFCYYWFHRSSHEVRFLWAAHENHHSSQHYNLSTALRQSWTTPLTSPIFWAPLALLGVEPLMILASQGISLIYQFWIHTELIDRLGLFEKIFNTPSHHRVHHGRNVRYLDRNHGGILIIWDRLFGTFEAEGEPVDYGLTKNLHSFNPLRIASHAWIDMIRDAALASGLGNVFRTFLKPPGWSADGSTLTASELRRQLA